MSLRDAMTTPARVTSLDGKTVYARVPGFETSETTDGFVLYNDGDKHVLFLNLAAAAILESCNGERSVDEIVHEIATGYCRDHGLRPDVEMCLSSLETSKVIVRRL